MPRPQMALLLGCKPWKWGKMDSEEKMDAFQRFLADNPKAVWRTKHRRNEKRLREIPYPLNLYFYWDNTIRFRANCIDIQPGNNEDWPIPPEFRDDPEPYAVGIFMDKLEQVEETHIEKFPKWDNPEDHYDSGNLLLARVQDIFLHPLSTLALG